MAEGIQALNKITSAVQYANIRFDAVRIANATVNKLIDAVQKVEICCQLCRPVVAKTKPNLRKVSSSDSELSQSQPSDSQANATVTKLVDAVRKAVATVKKLLDAVRKAQIVATTIYCQHYRSAVAKTKPKLRKVSSDSELSRSQPSDCRVEETIKGIFDAAREAEEAIKGIFDAAGEGIIDAEETVKGISDAVRQAEKKKFDPNLFKVSPSDGQEKKKFDPVLSEASPFDGCQETENFNPNLLESSSSDGEEKEEFVPNFFEVLFCEGQEMQNSHFRALELSIAKELTDSWFVPVDDRQEKMSDGNGLGNQEITSGVSSSEEEALLDKYLERLEAEDAATYKEEEVKCDPKLYEVSADGFESLTPLEKRHWIVLQFIRERYDPPIRSETKAPLLEVSDLEDSDQEESVGQQDVALGCEEDEQESEIEDCILDLNSLFLSND